MKNLKSIGIIVFIIVFIFSAYKSSKYIVGADEQVIIFQFGKIIKTRTEPGIYYKIPFYQKAVYYSRNAYTMKYSREITTLDKQAVLITTHVNWKISDLTKYYQTVRNSELAEKYISDIVKPAEAGIITTHNLDDILEESNAHEVGDIECKREIVLQIEQSVKPKLPGFGMELINLESKINIMKEN